MANSTEETFRSMSEEYAQAVDAFRAIESQAEALKLVGAHDQLLQFLQQFDEMATSASGRAAEEGLDEFVAWFDELKGSAMRMRRDLQMEKE